MTKALFKYDNFASINNVDPANRLPSHRDPATYSVITDVADIVNLDIDNSNALSTRPGSTLEVSGTFIHSLWSDNSTCFFIDGTKLYRLHEDYSITEMLSGLVYGERMSYTPFNDRIYMTNRGYIGYFYDGAMHSLVDLDMNYKKPLPAGQRIATFMAKLLVARENVLYIGDTLRDHYDVRTGYKVFENYITMLRPVGNGGVYVADGKTWFMAMDDNFKRKQVFDYDAIPYTDLVIGGDDVGEGTPEEVAIWVSQKGICVGNKQGGVKNLTEDKYVMDSYGIGSAVLREVNHVKHYIATLE